MDITITLYSTSDEPNKVEKTLSTNSFVITGKLKEEQDITAPAITIAIPILSTGVPATDIFQWNYAYISQPFKRYYFITGFDTGLNNLVTIYFKEDVLMSWKTNIYNLTPLVTRQATKYNPMLVDGNIPVDTIPKIETISIYLYDSLISEQTTDNYEKNQIIPNENSDAFNSVCVGFSVYARNVVMPLTETDYDMTNISTIPNNISNGRCYSNDTYYCSMVKFSFNYSTIIGGNYSSNLKNWFSNFSNVIMDINVLPINISNNFIPLEKVSELEIMGTEQNSMTTNNTYRCNNDSYHIYSSLYKKYQLDKNKNFLDSITKYTLILPFLGEIELDTDLLYNLSYSDSGNRYIDIYIYYITNLYTMKTTCYVLNNYIKCEKFTKHFEESGLEPAYDLDWYDIKAINLSNVIYKSEEFLMGVTLANGSTNFSEKQRNILFSKINSLNRIFNMYNNIPDTSSIYKKMSDKRLSKSGEKYQSYSKEYQNKILNYSDGVLSNVSNAAQDIIKSREVIPYIRGNFSGSFDKYTMDNRCHIRKYYYIPNIPSNYYELYGGPCNLTVPLSTLKDKGFTKCANLHMSGFSNCTLEEINEIEDLLLSGVIL